LQPAGCNNHSGNKNHLRTAASSEDAAKWLASQASFTL
jgi:hypothetical protein